MQINSRLTATSAAEGRLVWCALAVGIATSTIGAAEHPTIEVVRGRIQERWRQTRSLHIRVRQETTIPMEAEALAAWQTKSSLPEFSGTEDILFAFSGEKRYLRVLGLDCQAIARPGPLSTGDVRQTQTFDEARVWGGTTLRERTKDQHGRFHYRLVARDEAMECLAPPQYLMNVGFAVTDPLPGKGVTGKLHSPWFLPDALGSPSYKVANAIERVDGNDCVVVQCGNARAKDTVCSASRESVCDKLWLDIKRGFALRRRELRDDNERVRVVNRDFVEVLPGLWMPRRSRIEHFAPRGAAERSRDRPVLIRDIKLACFVANQVPSELFDVALTKPAPRPNSLFDVVRTYHWREKRFFSGSVNEVWAVKGLGRRMEVRKGTGLLLLSIDTPEWSLIWRPTLNRATLLPSRLEDRLREDASFVGHRGNAIRSAERLTALFRLQQGQLGDRKADKLTAYYPVDPLMEGNYPIHEFDPQLQRKLPGTDFRTREYWFAPTNGLLVHRRCGCKDPKWEATIDFPDPDSSRKNFFTFKLPEGADLEAANAHLKRLFHSAAGRQFEPSFDEDERR